MARSFPGESSTTDQPPSPWSVDRAFSLFESCTNLEKLRPELRHYRLDRMRDIMATLGGVPTSIPTIHVAGSKGKGSTTAYIAGLLAAGGSRVGVYTSPHIEDYRERFTILRPRGVIGTPGLPVEDLLFEESRQVWSVVDQYRRAGTEEQDLPTTFELLTALAFRLFVAADCDWIVLETGLGGRLDATNVCMPVLSLLTPIELEHTEYLGNTLAAIAREKAGIIKPGTPVLSSPQHPDALAVLRDIARERGSSFGVVPPRKPPSPPAMIGTVQHTNIALAIAAADLLNLRPPEREVRRVVAETRLPGRGELIGRVLLDGAHTAGSLELLLGAPETAEGVLIFGTTRGKPLSPLVSVLKRRFDRAIVCPAGTFKPEDPSLVADSLAEAGIDPIVASDPADAYRRARELAGPGGRIIVTGSLYLVAALRPLVIRLEAS